MTTVKGKDCAQADSRNMNLNVTFEDFMGALMETLVQPPARLKKDTIENCDATVSWVLTTVQANQRAKGNFNYNALSGEHHFNTLCTQIRGVATRNKTLANQILRIEIRLDAKREDGEATADNFRGDVQVGRSVTSLSFYF